MAPTTALREALNQGISSGNFVDTKIVLYSHRDSSGRVCRPKVIYANSHVLKTVPYFDDRESTFTPNTTRTEPYTVVPKVLFGNFAESQSKEFCKEAIDDEASATDYGYLSDSDLEDDESRWVASFKRFEHIRQWKVHPLNLFRVPCEEHEEHVGKGKVVKISDMAFVT